MRRPLQIVLPTKFSAGPVNAYLFAEPEPVLIDCGIDSSESWRALTEALATQGMSPADLKWLIVTHAHVDHMGMAGRVIANSPATLLIWEKIAPWAYRTVDMWRQRLQFLHVILNQYDLSAEDRDGILEGMSRMMQIWSTVPEERVETFGLDDSMKIGGRVWQVLHAPGHSPTQTCFYQRETRQLLAADMLLPFTPAPVLEQPLIGGYERDSGLPKLLHMFDKLEKMSIRHVYPGHGEPFSNHRELIRRQRQRIFMRRAECLQRVQKGNNRVGDLLDQMYPHQPRGTRLSGVSMLVGYLDLLMAEGKVEERIVDNMKRYYA